MCIRNLVKKLFTKSSKSDSIEETRFISTDSDIQKFELDGDHANNFVSSYLSYLVESNLVNPNKTIVEFIDSNSTESYTNDQLLSGRYYIVSTDQIIDLKNKINRYKIKVPKEFIDLIGK